MTELQVGIKYARDGVETQPIKGAEMSIVGIIGTAPGADAATFPYDTPVYMTASDPILGALLGTAGTIPDALRGVDGQLVDGTARCIVVRVAVGGSDAATIANIVGSSTARTGIWGFTNAPSALGFTPRLILASGWTSQQDQGVSGVTISNRGTGFTAAPTIAFSSGGGSGAAATATISKGVLSAAVGAGGTGYTTVSVAFAPPVGGGQAATGTATVVSGAVTAIAITSPGHGYGTSEVPAIIISGPGTGATATATMTGVIEAITITAGGTGYTSAPTIAFTGGAGTGAAATASYGVLANAVCAALPAVLGRLKAHAVVSGPVNTYAAWQAWRTTIQSDRIIPGSANDAKVLQSDGSIAVKPMDARIAGLLVRRDDDADGRPFRSAANQPVYDIVGVSRAVDFSISDETTEGQTIAGINGGFVVRGETGVESSLSDGGFVYWGTDNCSADANWQMYNVTRGRDYIELQQTRALRTYLGRYNITLATIDAITNTMDAQLSLAQAKGDILGYRLGFERDKNSPEELRLGHLWVKFKAEEAPVLKKITVSSQRYAQALVTLSNTVQSQIDALAA
jgi:phage tail sheath protein FI